MRITNVRAEPGPGARALSLATIQWEENQRPPFEMTFEWDSTRPETSRADVHAFLLASILPAWRRGERRVSVDGQVCPRLRDGLCAAQQLLSSWYGPDRKPVSIEPSRGFHPYDRKTERAGLFLTGGVDSLHMLRVNRRTFTREHPASFREAIYVPRLSFVEHVPSARSADLARRQAKVVELICAENGLSFCRLEGNFRLLDHENLTAAAQDQGALLSAVAHALTPRIGSVSVAASLDASDLSKYGTHPLLDPNYSSSGLEFRNEGMGFTRLEKVGEIADWPTAQENLLVCFEGPMPAGRPNCGECEKCLRTMTELFVLDALDRFPVFGDTGVTPEKIERMSFGYHSQFFECDWQVLLGLLTRRRCFDLARAVSKKLAGVRKHRAWIEERDWRGRVRRFDRKLLNGWLLAGSRRIRRLPNAKPTADR